MNERKSQFILPNVRWQPLVKAPVIYLVRMEERIAFSLLLKKVEIFAIGL